MLVVDLVECGVVDNGPHVGVLEDEEPVRREQPPDAREDGVDVGDVADDVGRDDRVGSTVERGNVGGRALAEERLLHGQALARRRRQDVAGGVDAEMAEARRGERLQQDAVVAADLDHEGRLDAAEPLLHVGGVGAEVAAHARRDGREVDVRVVKHVMVRHAVAELDQAARFAESDREVEEEFVGRTRRVDERVGQRHPAE